MNEPPNKAAIQSQLEINSGLWALMVPSSNLNTTSAKRVQKISLIASFTYLEHISGDYQMLPVKLFLVRHSLIRLAFLTWNAFVIS